MIYTRCRKIYAKIRYQFHIDHRGTCKGELYEREKT
ncbi:hypothetical protein CLOL250_01260 [Clostridium sp. L2-50]|nr:hypothetical protein CLOL250_01260 [Clostridium sp. L2-50]